LVKGHPDAELWQVKRTNRDGLPSEIMEWLQAGAGRAQ
jgi:hypothetical protein